MHGVRTVTHGILTRGPLILTYRYRYFIWLMCRALVHLSAGPKAKLGLPVPDGHLLHGRMCSCRLSGNALSSSILDTVSSYSQVVLPSPEALRFRGRMCIGRLASSARFSANADIEAS